MKYNLTNIKNFLQGYSRLYYDKYVGLPLYQKEQIDYRLNKCKDDCAITKKCIHCGCTFPDRAFTIISCNHDRFPDILSEDKWKQFKIKNGNIHK